MIKKILFVFVFLLCISSALSAEEFIWKKHGEIPLLAVREMGEGEFKGSAARLSLDIIPGKGRVFLETNVLTQVDTQISTRYAKDIACDYINMDCSNMDFIYSIEAESRIIGGPSAGSAISLLTIALLKDFNLNDNMAVTATINSGGLLGLVGGVKQKIEAAESIGIKKVIVAKGERFEKEDNNYTIDLKAYAEEKGVSLIETSDINELVYEFTGETLRNISVDEKIDDTQYNDIMKEISEKLCSKTKSFEVEKSNSSEYINAEDKINKSIVALSKKDYYSAASYCFSANILLGYLELEKKSPTFDEIKNMSFEQSNRILRIEEKVRNYSIESVNDIQSYQAVMERLDEAKPLLKDVRKDDKINLSNRYYALSYATERINSAQEWKKFFEMKGDKVDINPKTLKNACYKKIKECEERRDYLQYYIPNYIPQNKIDELYELHNENKDILCIVKASITKAEINAIISSMGLSEENSEEILESKFDAIKRSIIRNKDNGFPLLGYAYYNYAKELKYEITSSILFAEYALELSNLNMYFPKENKLEKQNFFNMNYNLKKTMTSTLFWVLIIGLILFILGYLIGSKNKNL